MKTRSTIIVTLLMCFMLSYTVKAQVVDDTTRCLIVSEMFIDGGYNGYYELTNECEDPVNLGNFSTMSDNTFFVITNKSYDVRGDGAKRIMLPEVELQPGESFVAAYVLDYAEKQPELDLPRTNRDIWEQVDYEVHRDEDTPGDNGGEDSINHNNKVPVPHNQTHSFMSLKFYVGDDSVMVDGIRMPYNPSTNELYYESARAPIADEIAGVPNAYANYLLVRKTSVAQGNVNWLESKGTNAENSEWILIPEWDNTAGTFNPFFTTLGNHDAADISAEYIKSDVLTIDFDNGTIEVPWGIYTDSIMQEFNLENGLAWDLHYSPEREDSVHNIVTTGDTLTFYAVGEEVEMQDFHLEQAAAPEDMNLVFPKNRQIRDEDDHELVWYTPFYVTEGAPEMDSVGSIEYATRVDTLLKYLEKAPSAEWEIVWKDDTERPDVERGDILKITASNGDVKEYYLAVDTMPILSDDASLGAIRWPDVPEAVSNFNPNWRQDTIPGFASTRLSYTLELPYKTVTTVPPLDVVPSDLNATVEIERAKTIRGVPEDRTTTITVTSESDTIQQVYTVRFEEEKPDEFVQPFKADPIISYILYRDYNVRHNIQISNPGNQPLDLRNYAFVRIAPGSTPPVHISDSSYVGRWQVYTPGYLYQSEDQYNIDPGIYVEDNEVNPILGPGESFLIEMNVNNNTPAMTEDRTHVDVLFTNKQSIYDDMINNREEQNTVNARVIFSPEFFPGNHFMRWWLKTEGVALYKITNDTVKDGLKGRVDPSDFEMIDLFGDYSGEQTWYVDGDSSRTGSSREAYYRKPQYWQGDTLPGYQGSWGPTPEESEWIVEEDVDPDDMGATRGFHAFDPITVYMSTVSSSSYKVSDGYTDFQEIEGVPEGTTESQLIGNLQTLEGQTLDVLHRGESDAVLDEDTLMVQSKDENNVTHYIIHIGAPDDNATLTSSEYEISIDGTTGSIAGIPAGTTIETVLENVTVPSTAQLLIINDEDEVAPINLRNYNLEKVKTKASPEINFEVVAENGSDMITYQLMLDMGDSDAIILSDKFEVDQEKLMISYVPLGIRVPSFMDQIMTNEGATVKIYKRGGFERTKGELAFDDMAVVTSPDGSTQKAYFLGFNEEPIGSEAWIMSDELEVNQVEETVKAIPSGSSISDVEGMLTVAPDATWEFMDAEGSAVSSGEVATGYHLKVTSQNGLVDKVYELTVATSVDSRMIADINIYPNPARDILHVAGITSNSRIEVKNILGKTVRMMTISNERKTTVNIENLASGVYFISVTDMTSNENKTIKFIKQ